MKNILEEIVSRKKETIVKYKSAFSLKNLEEKISSYNNYLNFKNKLIKEKISIIAEIKKASPSAGILIKNYNPEDIARQYFNAGAACLSILTEEHYFLGKLEHIYEVKKEIKLPILCKDFFIDPFQVYLAKSFGADAILIILSAADKVLAKEIYSLSNELNISTIIEVHDKKEAEYALNFKNAIIGINNRNLKNLKTDISITYDLHKILTDHNGPIICESGIKSEMEIKEILKKTRINNFLIGESLLKSNDITSKLRKFSQISL